MTPRPSSNAAPRRRRVLALAVTLAAAVASAASLDMAAPVSAYMASSPPQITVLSPAAPTVTSAVTVTATNMPTGVELVVNAQVTWAGGDGGLSDGGAPVATATLGPDATVQVDAGAPPDAGLALASPAGSGALLVSAGQPCAGDPCAVTFTLTLSEAPPAQEIVVTWTAEATITSGGNPPAITITVTP